ncbi:MAG: lactonase family protein [Polyangiaceae bacterium]|nr:lactonase family protein [Polyangiaceae bacterium]
MKRIFLGGDTDFIIGDLTDAGVTRPSLAKNSLARWSRAKSYSPGAVPSFLAFDKKRSVLHVVLEGSDQIVSYDISTDVPRWLGAVDCPGGPCHLSIAEDASFAFASCYGGGEAHQYRILSDGRLSPRIRSVSVGRNTHSVVQVPGRPLFWAASLGDDLMEELELTPGGGLTRRRRWRTPQGMGPRHTAFSPSGRFAYVVGECDASLHILDVETLTEVAVHPLLNRSFQAGDSGADVHLSADGKLLYASSRGFDALSIFRCADESRLEFLERISSQGEIPRSFSLVGDSLVVVANQESHQLSVFGRDAATGLLSPEGSFGQGQRIYWAGASGSS